MITAPKPTTDRSLVALAAAALLAAAWMGPAAAQDAARHAPKPTDWPHWRGPDYSGISKETGWSPAALAGEAKVLWRANVGTGYSSFAVAAGRAYTMGNSGNKDTVFCFDAETGQKLWSHTYDCPLDPKFHDGGPNATPTVDGDRVYTISKRGHLFSFEAATGKVVWSHTLAAERPTWGFAGSPFISGELVIYNVGSAGLALEKAGGKVRWDGGKGESGYSTCVPFPMGQAKAMALFLKDSVAAIAPDTGKVFWQFRWKTLYDVNAADPIIAGTRMFISSGYNRGCALLDFASGKPAAVWENKEMRNHFNSCVLIDGHLYGFDEDELKCLDWSTGRTVWGKKRLGKGALMAADGKLIIMADDPLARTRGTLRIAEATAAAYTELAAARVLAGRSRCWTTPILSGGRIYCRDTRGEVACVDVKGN